MLNYSAISVTWDELPCEDYRNITMYMIEIRTVANSNTFVVNVSADSYEVILNNLDSNTTYIIRISTWNNAGYGIFSDEVNVSIPQAG